MANTLASAGTHASRSPFAFCNPHPLSWIKRRTRRLEQFFMVKRREALACAVLDFFAFHPTAAK